MLDWLLVTEGIHGARLLNSNLSPYWTFNLILWTAVNCKKNYCRKLYFCSFQGREKNNCMGFKANFPFYAKTYFLVEKSQNDEL